MCPESEEAAREIAFKLEGRETKQRMLIRAGRYKIGGVGRGGELEGVGGEDQRNVRTIPEDDPVVCEDEKKTSEEEINLVGVVQETADHFFPHFNDWLNEKIGIAH